MKVWDSVAEACKILNVKITGINNVTAKRARTAYGFKWEYLLNE